MKFSDLDYIDKIQILDAIGRRLKNLKKEVKQERENSNKCSHPKIVDISTINDIRNGVRKKMCQECRESWEVSLNKEE